MLKGVNKIKNYKNIRLKSLNNNLDEENSIQKIIIKEFKIIVQNLENKI